MNGYVNEVIRLYYKGYSAAEAIKIVKADMKIEALEKAVENYKKGKEV